MKGAKTNKNLTGKVCTILTMFLIFSIVFSWTFLGFPQTVFLQPKIVQASPGVPPTIVANTADGNNFIGNSTPTLEFTGTDPNSDSVRYNVQIYGNASSFIGLNATGATKQWYGVSVNSTNGDVYADASSGDIYKQTGGTGAFNALGAGTKTWLSVAVNSTTSDVYASINTGYYLYKQTGGKGSFNTLAVIGAVKSWRGVAVNPTTGDVYVAVFSGDIYKQTGGTGAFNALGAGIKTWQGVAVNSTNGDVYADESSGDIYKQTGGTGAFNALGAGIKTWLSVAVNSTNGDVYASVSNGDIYKQTGGTGAFIVSGAGTKNWQSVAVNPTTGDVYAVVYNGDIYKQSGGLLLYKISGTNAGFLNTINGGNTDPFTSGQKVSYTVQAGDALAPGTYTWRVRAIDPTGSNTYSSWTNMRSFIITTATSITYASISGTPQVSSVLTATVSPGGATATYQWQESTTSGGTYTNISGATSPTYTPVSGDIGKYIEVVATGTGSYSGTVTSSPTAVVTSGSSTLSCSITTAAACSGTVLLRMSGSSNAHAELPSMSTANYNNNVVCCVGPIGFGNSCFGNYKTFARLSGITGTNAQVEEYNQTNLNYNTEKACISSSLAGDAISIGYKANDCTGYDTTLFSMDKFPTNATVGSPAIYNNKVCAKISSQSISFNLSSASAGFGNLTSSGLRYATADGVGSTTETESYHLDVSTNASAGYVISLAGDSLKKGSTVITPIGATNITPTPGTKAFGIRAMASGGTGTVLSPYSGTGFGYNATSSSFSPLASESMGDGSNTTYSVHSVATIDSLLDPGTYSTNITYIVTGNF